jgi:hypothetical protein
MVNIMSNLIVNNGYINWFYFTKTKYSPNSTTRKLKPIGKFLWKVLDRNSLMGVVLKKK